MDEDLGVKVARNLRKRLSVEAEGAQSPGTPSTPTKKRGTRLAKPALELIDENEGAPKRSARKTVARDTNPVEEKVLTPSRRSTRIRSNTSLVLEAAPVADSPRAKRAARRNSQLGSDTETATTPARQTRRTRKDSTSSLEKQAVSNTIDKAPVLVTDVITEEPEKEIKESSVGSKDISPPRKSPRLNKNHKKSVNEPNKTDNVDTNKGQNDNNDNATESEIRNIKPQIITTINEDSTGKETHSKSLSKIPVSPENKNISISSSQLIINIERNPQISSMLNKTVSGFDDTKTEKSNRKRTKSWTTMTNKDNANINSVQLFNKEPPLIGFDAGDGTTLTNEKAMNRSSNISINKSFNEVNSAESDNKENIHHLKMDEKPSDTIKLMEITSSVNVQSTILMEDSDSNSDSMPKLTIDLQNNCEEQNDAGDQCVPVINQHSPRKSPRKSESFACEPMDIDETIPTNVTINDYSDKTDSSREDLLESPKKKLSFSENNKSETKIQLQSNQSKQRKSSIRISGENSVSSSKENNDASKISNHSKVYSLIQHDLNTSEIKSSIAEPDDKNNSKVFSNILRNDKSASMLQDNKSKSSLYCQSENSDKINNDANKSKRKSLLSESENIDKSCNENKSTLVLSHIKDISSTTANVSNSPNDTQTEISKLDTDTIKNKEDKIKNVSQKYSTSTPLQQKPLQKLAMQIHSPLIGLNGDNKNNTKENSETDDDSSDELIDAEAEDAGEDYESGDSRDEEQRQYEEENEIVEKGETLESEYFSNDSDYDKDSFVVSSDEEDEELLSASGDDLSLSDNELKMTAKSKKKYNERKVKQQKKASKEMYEARHKLKESQNNSKVNKSGKSRVDSSALQSNDDEPQPQRKMNRRRIDSSQDASLSESDDNEIIHKKKKKVKRLTESVSEDTTQANENEITISNETILEKNDPLSVAVKIERKTPQKNLDIPIVTINSKIEEIQADKSLNKSNTSSIVNQNETSDPLQATLPQDGEDSESDISENLEIKQNYESILENLNNSNKKQKIKTMDMSLNLNKKTKDTVKNPTLDALNISQSKKSKKNTEIECTEKLDKLKPSDTKTGSSDEESSDSIDMKLLFPEESNDSDVNATKFQNDKTPQVDPAEEFIPLKKSDAKTNIRESMELNTSRKETKLNLSSSRKSDGNFINTSVNKEQSVGENVPSSGKKNKKHRKLSENASDTNADQTNDISLGFFIDTLGAYGQIDVSAQSNSKKKKKNKHDNNDSVMNKSHNISVTEKQFPEPQENIPNETSNVSVKSDKKKKKNKNTSHSFVEETTELNHSKTKKSNQTLDNDNGVIEKSENIQNETSINVSVKNDKKKKKNKNNSHSLVEETLELNHSQKEKSNQSVHDNGVIEKSGTEEIPDFVSSDKKKKKKKNKSLETSQIIESIGEDSNVFPLEVSYKSKQAIDLDVAENFEESENRSGKKKKNKKNKHTQPDIDQTTHEVGSKKRKRNLSSHASSDTIEEEIRSNQDESSAKKHKQKKIKTTDGDEDNDAPTEEKIIYTEEITHTQNNEETPKKKAKKNKKSKKNKIPKETEQEVGATQNKPKKRKADELDVSDKKSKVSKNNSLDDIHVPRLPQSIVNELDDQPPKDKKQKKVKAIATTAFEVEQAKPRRNKPSNYLEESVYLNDDLSVKKKSKSHIKKPKVLPFTPTVITSEHGFTSNFRINTLPEDFQFVAQATNMPNFKNERLADRRVKKLGTFERYKQHRGYKLSKF